MNLRELVQRAKQSSPDLESLSERNGIELLRQVFKGIAAELERVEDGVVRINELGRFRIKPIEREKDGEKEVIKRIVFLPAISKRDGQ